MKNITQLLKKHDVAFSIKRYDTVNKILPTARGGGVANFLDDFKDYLQISEGLELLNYYLDGGAYNWEYQHLSSDSFSAYVDMDEDKVIVFDNTDPEFNDPIQEIPVQDFKGILEEWLNFLKKYYN